MNQEWQKVKIKEICDVFSGSTPSTRVKEYWGEGYNFITPLDLSKKHKFLGKVEFKGRDITAEGFSNCSTIEIPKDSIVMSSRAPIGYLAINKLDKAVTNQGCKSLAIKDKNKVDIEYLYYRLDKDIDKIKRLGSGSTFLEVAKNDLENFEFLLPPLSSQKEIAEILSKVDEDIEKTGNVIKQTKKLKRGVLKELFTKGVGHSKFKKTKLGMIPEEWNIVKLNDICEKVTDGTHATPKYISQGIPFLRVTDIQDSEIDWKNVKYISKEEHEELIKRCKPEKGDVLLSKNGTIGITKIVDWDREFSIFVSLCLIKPNNDIVDSVFLEKVISSDLVMNQAKARSKQGTVTNLHLEEIRDFDIPLPSITEQKNIAEAVVKIEFQLNVYQKIKINLELLRQGLMQDLLK